MPPFQDDRESILSELSEKQAKCEQLRQEVEKYRECDPEVMEKMKEDAVTAKDAANRWTGMQYTDVKCPVPPKRSLRNSEEPGESACFLVVCFDTPSPSEFYGKMTNIGGLWDQALSTVYNVTHF